MPQHKYQSGRYAIVLDNGTVISDPSYHCLCPFVANNFVFMAICGPNNKFRVRNLTTGQNLDVQVSGAGGAIEWATDGRYVIGAQRVTQGKHWNGMSDLLACIFDTQESRWLNFSSLPEKDVFHNVGAGPSFNALWIKNGGQVGGWPGIVGRTGIPSFPQPNLIRFTINGVPKERTIDLATGAMGALV